MRPERHTVARTRPQEATRRSCSAGSRRTKGGNDDVAAVSAEIDPRPGGLPRPLHDARTGRVVGVQAVGGRVDQQFPPVQKSRTIGPVQGDVAVGRAVDIHVHHDHARHSPGGHPDVRRRGRRPPGADPVEVRGGVVKPVPRQRLLAAIGDREHRDTRCGEHARRLTRRRSSRQAQQRLSERRVGGHHRLLASATAGSRRTGGSRSAATAWRVASRAGVVRSRPGGVPVPVPTWAVSS